ncbi:hypothetical protein Tco_0345468 [Tanacetum coccineum]
MKSLLSSTSLDILNVSPTYQQLESIRFYREWSQIDQVLKNLKFANKGAKDPVFGMPIPMVMLNDEIKASADYADYLANTKGGKLKGRGKGPVTMKGVEVVVEKIAYVRVPKTKRTYTLTEQSGQSEGVEDDADFEETEEEDEIPLVQRQTRVVIGRQVHQESDEEALDHSKKLKGVERMSETTEFLLQLKKAKKAKRPKCNKGLSVTLVVPDEPSGSSSSSTSKYEIKDISSDDESDGADDKEKADDSMTTGDEKVVEEQADEEHVGDEQHVDDQGGNEQARNIQAKIHVSEPHIENPEATLLSSSQTLSSAEYGNQFINVNPDVSINDVLKEPVEPEVQSLVDKKDEAMSSFNIPEAIDKSVKAHLMKNVLLKGAQNFGKIRKEKATKQSILKYSTTPFDEDSLMEYDQKDKLLKMMMKSVRIIKVSIMIL